MMTVYQKTATTATLCVVLGLGAAACGGRNQQVAVTPPPPMPTAPDKPPAPPTPPAPTAAPSPRALTEDELFAKKTPEQLNNERPLADVFFDLDQSTIKEEGRASLATNANWLKRWTGTRIDIEGHCDERGTAEYNLGLGERRANAVKAYLVELGVAADRIAVVSKGKEAPFCTESNESCWLQNRRGHFVITANNTTTK
jgi:peptidoglycan-associated lipoprotein